MSEQFIPLHLTATSTITGAIPTTTTTSIVPQVKRFQASVVLGNILGGVTTIPSNSFKDDSGTTLAANSLPVPGSNGYYNVFVNGTLLLGGTTTLTSASLSINSALTIGVTVLLETITFTATSTSTSSTGSLNVATTVHTSSSP